MNKENKLRGGNRKMQFMRRRKALNIDPNAPGNSFFVTVGSPIKMGGNNHFDVAKEKKARDRQGGKDEVQPDAIDIGALAIDKNKQRPQRLMAPSVNSEAATLDLKQKAALKHAMRKKQQQQQQQQEPAADVKESPKKPTADEESNIATVKRGEGGNDTDFLVSTVEPVQQLKLDGAKKAKIPHFLSAWFNAGHDTKETPDDTTDAVVEKPKENNGAAANNGGEAANGKAENGAVVPAVNKDRTPNNGAVRNSYSQSIDFSEITLGRLIGEGAFGKVHEGKWRGKSVAVKLLICQDLRSDILHEFQSEVEIMSVLRHPNICRLLGACLEPPHRALVVELMQRGSLWGVLRMNRKSITQEMRSRFIYDTAKGMSYLHHFERPILHRDLKSPNLLVDKNFNIKLSDFGLARVKAHVQTMTGNCGTVQWMAPEVLGNQKYTEKADVFSFGIVIWEIVTGECPYDGMSQIQAALGVLNRNLRPNIPRDCPPFFSRLMKACWNRQPELRPSFPHIVNAFRTYQSSISESRATSSAAASAQAAIGAAS